jgi:hypothetical protein
MVLVESSATRPSCAGSVNRNRTEQSPCDALSWNTSRQSEGVERLLAHCMSHGRRQFVEVAENFPEECRYVLETLGGIWHHDALAREQKLSPEERLGFASATQMLPSRVDMQTVREDE